MSTRNLRKLMGAIDLGAQSRGSDSECSDDNVVAPAVGGGAKKKQQLNFNRFDVLNQQSHSESDIKEDDNEMEPVTDQSHEFVGEGSKQAMSGKKKKTRKKMKPGKIAAKQRSNEDVEDDEFGGPFTSSATVEQPQVQSPMVPPQKALLNIEYRYLNVSYELKRKFGVKVVQSGRKKTPRCRTYVRPAVLISPKENWPTIVKQGLGMLFGGECNSKKLFVFAHSQEYQAAQRDFFAAVDSLETDGIIRVVNKYTYHVDALLQLSELCRMNEDFAMAADFVERALFALENAFHPSFSLTQGNCSVDYRYQQNRALYIALFRHMTYVGQRACHRTALELCKLILSLDPKEDEDPLAVILIVDLYALRSRQFDWLLRVASEWEAMRNLSQLPNFAYSKAVAQFHLDRQAASAAAAEDAYALSDELLQQALIMFPSVLMPLLEKCSVQVDSGVSSHAFFNSRAQASTTPALAQLVQLYVARIWPVWKDVDLLPWMERNTKAVIQRVNNNDPLVAECEAYRRKRYQGALPRNIARHIALVDLKDVPQVVQEDYRSPVMMYDPLPPLNSIDVYPTSYPRIPRRAFSENPVTSFFEAMLPSYHRDLQRIGEAAAQEGRNAVQEGRVAQAAEVRRSLTTLMGTLRDLLQTVDNANAPEDENNADAEVNSSSDDDPADHD